MKPWPPINENPKEIFSIHIKIGSFQTDWHAHPKHQFLYSEDGILHLHTEKQRLILPARHGAWIPAHRSHKIYSNSQTLHLHSLYFKKRQDDKRIQQQFHIFPISTLAREMILFTRKWPTEGEMGQLEQSFLETIRLLSIEWFNQTIPLVLPTTEYSPLSEITAYMHTNLANQLQLNHVAAQFGLSGRTLLRLFKKQLGMTFGTYLRVARIIQAIELLTTPNASVTDVAYAVGYKSLSTFSTTFQQLTGVNPRDYLRSLES